MQIKISDATFSHYLPSIVPISWDIQSDNISDVTLTGTSLAVTQNGAAGNYETAASSNLQKATITMPIGSPSAVNVVVLGELTSLDYAVLYLDGTGTVRQFHKDGNVLTLPTILPWQGQPQSLQKVLLIRSRRCQTDGKSPLGQVFTMLCFLRFQHFRLLLLALS